MKIQSEHHNLGDTISLISIVLALFLYALSPNLIIRSLVVFAGLIGTCYLSYKSYFVRGWSPKLRILLALALCTTVITFTFLQLYPLWKDRSRDRKVVLTRNVTSREITPEPVSVKSVPTPAQKHSRVSAKQGLPAEVPAPKPHTDVPEQPSPAPAPPAQASSTQIMQNSPGGMMAGHDLTVYGPVPKPDRTLDPEDVAKALKVLQAVPKHAGVMFMTYPNRPPPNSEIPKFERQIEGVFRQGGWPTYLERDIFVGFFSNMTENGITHGEGVGCTISNQATKEVATAVYQALALLHYPCGGAAITQSANDEFPVSILVGTRIEPEQ